MIRAQTHSYLMEVNLNYFLCWLLFWELSFYDWGLKATWTEHSVCVTCWCVWILASSNRYVRECLHVCTWLCVYMCVFAFVFQEERVVPDRAESSQPISQHHCDIDLSAHRRWGGGMRGLMGRQEWGQREASKGRRLAGWGSLRGEKGDGKRRGIQGEQSRWVSSRRCVSMFIV